MDLEAFTSLFSGSPYKLLQQHRACALDALLAVNRQVLCLSAETPASHPSPSWIKERPRQLKKLEQAVISRLNKPSLTSLPKTSILDVLQNQSHLALQIFRLSERLAVRPLKLPVEMIVPINLLTSRFGKTICQFRETIIKQDELNSGVFKKHQSHSLQTQNKGLTQSVERLRMICQDLRDDVCQFQRDIEPVDVALLCLILDDIIDLSFWMKSLLEHQKI
ncbi:hypothetical protein EOPP23_09750 [Endozoicomonas sp. OPT23]|uniref:hypothetical protein n=1 Tax=Endozoicomonas sp. OPT23 TaxID=2072845 RepID=UPI00129BD95B|nr:hypothetical protein [Endozoicomonas sp. OPT23]MRI33265.1 hypothetical protein [Endozoicomonas sp. OPT23]